MQDRFKQILEENGLTAQKIAVLIGIDASAVSHLLNGRRKPSFEVLDKIGQAFPDINLNWLISGKGNMHNGDVQKNNSKIQQKPIQKSLFEEEEPLNEQTEQSIKNPLKKNSTEIDPAVVMQQAVSNKHIKRIILFFDDGSFEDYTKS